jgi:probable F420-dependent oxidoreductase
MDFWMAVMFEGTEQLLDIARSAEELGYAGIAVADHIAVPASFASVHPSGENPFDHRTNFPDPFATIAAMSVVTTRLRFMPYVYILPMRDPFSVAKQAGTVAMLSNDRLVLGVGAGWLREELELIGHDPSTRGRRLDEMIEVIRRFWSDGVAEFHGAHYSFGPTGMFPKPSRPIPVWVGGKSDAALDRAARNDGWVGMNYDLEEIEVLLGRLRERRAAQGRTDVPFETLVIANAMPSPDLYAQLTSWGVTSTVCTPWALGDPRFATFAAKRDAMEAFAASFLA